MNSFMQSFNWIYLTYIIYEKLKAGPGLNFMNLLNASMRSSSNFQFECDTEKTYSNSLLLFHDYTLHISPSIPKKIYTLQYRVACHDKDSKYKELNHRTAAMGPYQPT